MNFAIVATIVLGLIVDQEWPAHGQAVVSLAAWLVLVVLWVRSEPRLRPALAACLVFATVGELILSLVWGLYEYRLGNLPLFVPPGHVLLFFLGTQIAARIPNGREWWIALAALPPVALLAYSGRDTLGPILYAMLLACMFLSRSRKLYATMFVLALSMELYGTWLGNWTWSRVVPGLGLTAENPPLTAGVFYSVLDLLVVSVVSRWTSQRLAGTTTRGRGGARSS
ncbi:MAG: hypothetical protein U0V87_15595 [Acidobacteriota bacterium]